MRKKTLKLLIPLGILIAIGYYYHIRYLKNELAYFESECMTAIPLNVDIKLEEGVCDGKTLSRIGASTDEQNKYFGNL